MKRLIEGALLCGFLVHCARPAKVDMSISCQLQQEAAVEASRSYYTYSEEPSHLSSAVWSMFNVSAMHDEASLLSIKTNKAPTTQTNEDEAVLIYYSNGFFGNMPKEDYSERCGIPCVRAAFPDEAAQQRADAFMVFPIDSTPPTNERGAVALGHTEEAIALYGGQNAGRYEAMADMNWRSTVPWTYFDPIQMMKRKGGDILGSAGWEARKPAAVFVARNCGGSDRNALIEMLIAHGVEVDSISSCKPGGSSGSWPADVPQSNKVGAVRKYRVYLALENRKEEGYVTEKVADGLMSGAAVVYLGAPDIDNYVPDTALINANNYDKDIKRIVSQIKEAISDKTKWDSYRSWLTQSPEQWNNGKVAAAFSYSDGKPAECRLCRFAYAKRMGLGWDWSKQQPAHGSVPPNGDNFWKTWQSVKRA